MLTGIQNGIKKFIVITVGLFYSGLRSESQPMYLQPEIDIGNGLQSNSVRVIREDDRHRIWLGTDQGLVILNDNDSSFKNITAALSGQQVHGIAFNKEHVFLGSWFKGLYVYNLKTGQLEKRFDTAQVGLCYRVKEIRDTIFFGTTKAAFYLVNKNGEWIITKIKCADPGAFPDFILWQNRVYGAMNGAGNQCLYQFQNDSLVRSPLIKPHEFLPELIGVSMAANDSEIAIAGEGFDVIINNKQEKKFEKIIPSHFIGREYYTVEDIEIVSSRIFLTIGHQGSLGTGMIYEPGKISSNNLRNDFFGFSLYYDKAKKYMWAGTFNNGIYLWPFPGESFHIDLTEVGDLTFKPMNTDEGMLYNKIGVYKINLLNQKTNKIFDNSADKRRWGITYVTFWHDTVAVALTDSLFLLNMKTNKYTAYPCAQGNYIFKSGLFCYVFSIYNNVVTVVNLKTHSSHIISLPSDHIRGASYKGNLFYHSANTGFYYFDSVSHPFNIPFPLLEDYTILSDTLWTLQTGVIKTFRIDLPHYKLIPLFENNIKQQLNGFSPKWIISNGKHIYCGDDKGVFDIETTNGSPRFYTYLGNFSQGEPPTAYGNYLYFNQQNYITRVDPDSLKFTFNPSEVSFEILPDKTIYRQTPFFIQVKANDYILQKHSLKEIQILKKGKIVSVFFTTNDRFDFPSGMKNGNYTVRIKINGVFAGEKNLHVKIPLIANPLFYILISLFVIAFFFILFRYILNKRSYDRHILDNRLQLLKQNLNPHFVFNSLNLIYSLVLQRKNEAAIKTINNFSDLHRYYLDNIGRSTISLEEELKFIESYLKLESERVELDSPFAYFLPDSLDDTTKKLLVPPMILQPLAENAVKYCGAERPGLNDRSIWVDVKREGMRLIVGIENTITYPAGTHKYGKGLGLKLVRERIEIFNKKYKKNVLFDIKDRPVYCNKGYRCELTFNFEKQ